MSHPPNVETGQTQPLYSPERLDLRMQHALTLTLSMSRTHHPAKTLYQRHFYNTVKNFDFSYLTPPRLDTSRNPHFLCIRNTHNARTLCVIITFLSRSVNTKRQTQTIIIHIQQMKNTALCGVLIFGSPNGNVNPHIRQWLYGPHSLRKTRTAHRLFSSTGVPNPTGPIPRRMHKFHKRVAFMKFGSPNGNRTRVVRMRI